MGNDRQLLRQQRIAIRQKTVDRIQRRTAVASLKRERTTRQAVFPTKHGIECREIVPCGCPLNTHEFRNCRREPSLLPKIFQRCQSPLMLAFVVMFAPIAAFEIPPQQSARVQNFRAHDRSGNVHPAHAGTAHLSPSQLHMLGRQPCGHTSEPSAETEPANRHIPAQQLTNALRRHLRIAVETKLRDIQQAHFLDDFPVFFDLQAAFRLAHPRSLLGYIHGAGLRVARHQTARRLLRNLSKKIDFVRQANAHQRAVGTLGAVDQRRRSFRQSGSLTQFFQSRHRLVDQLVVKMHLHSAFAARIIDAAAGAHIASLPQQQSRCAKLRPMRLPSLQS